MINLNNKVFITVENSTYGDTNNQTFFHYLQKGNKVSAKYFGGPIKTGFLSGIIDSNGELDMQYHHVNSKNELLTGVCHSQIQKMIDGKIRIIENWSWTSRTFAKGQSILEEVNDDDKANYLKIATGF